MKIGRGQVSHHRSEGATHRFRYPTFFVQADVSGTDADPGAFLRRRSRGILSLKSADYLQGLDLPLGQAVHDFLRERCGYEASEVRLQTMPRMFGYAFNPVSFWFCRRAGQTDAVLVEVNNTFGERHFYWIHPEGGIDPAGWYEARKVFHVSPFFPVEGFYRFRFVQSEEKSRVDINYHAPEGSLRLATWVEGDLQDAGDVSILDLLWSYGWMTPLVVLRIHSQALRLWLKRISFYRKPQPPTQEISG